MRHFVKKYIYIIAVFLLLLVMFLIQSSNINYVVVNENKAEVIINFLLPMKQEEFEQSLKIQNNLPYANEFECQVEWLSNQSVKLTVLEQSFIKGQSINLVIDKAPTTIKGIFKTINIPINFKVEPELLTSEKMPLIATTQMFNIRFNTPIKKQDLLKAIESDVEFDVEEAVIYTPSGKVKKDLTSYVFKPKTELENNKDYTITFKAGMSSKNGVYTSDDLIYTFKTDNKPIIESVSPPDGSNWIGLYPRFTLKANTAISKAILTLNGERIEGEILSDNSAYFYPSSLLEPQMLYNAQFDVVAPSGELADPVHITFNTVPVGDDRIWIEVLTEGESVLNVYKGNEKIKSFSCAVGSDQTPTTVGTFYVLEKIDSFFDPTTQQGANMNLKLSEGVDIIGLIRDPYWNIKQSSYSILGTQSTSGVIMLSEEDMMWLYKNIPLETMVVIHP